MARMIDVLIVLLFAWSNMYKVNNMQMFWHIFIFLFDCCPQQIPLICNNYEWVFSKSFHSFKNIENAYKIVILLVGKIDWMMLEAIHLHFAYKNIVNRICLSINAHNLSIHFWQLNGLLNCYKCRSRVLIHNCLYVYFWNDWLITTYSTF